MRQKQSRGSRSQERDEFVRSSENDSRRKRSTYDEDNNWAYEDDRSEPYAEEENYREEEYAGDFGEENHKERGRGRSRRSAGRSNTSSPRSERRRAGSLGRPSYGGRTQSSRSTSRRGVISQDGRRSSSRRSPGSRSTTTRRSSTRSRRTSSGGTSMRGFASMPRSEVRRIAAMGGRASHGGGRTPTRRTTGRRRVSSNR